MKKELELVGYCTLFSLSREKGPFNDLQAAGTSPTRKDVLRDGIVA